MLSLICNFSTSKSSTVAATQTGISSFNLIKSVIISTLDFLFSLSRPFFTATAICSLPLPQSVHSFIPSFIQTVVMPIFNYAHRIEESVLFVKKCIDKKLNNNTFDNFIREKVKHSKETQA